MVLIKRSANEILQKAVKILHDNTPITNFKAGAIARALLESMKDELPAVYDYAEETMNMGFLSKSKDEYLDLIGALFSYSRRTIEVADSNGKITTTPIDDKTYRYEISQRVLVAANANYTALRLNILTVAGVADCIGKEYTHGTGSFSFTIIPEFGYTLSSIKGSVESVVSETKAYGIRPNIIFPVQIPLEMIIEILFKSDTSESEKEQIRTNLSGRLYKYFGNYELGQSFIYNDFVQEVMDANPKISDFSIIKFYLNNQPTLLTNQNILSDEMITPKDIKIQ